MSAKVHNSHQNKAARAKKAHQANQHHKNNASAKDKHDFKKAMNKHGNAQKQGSANHSAKGGGNHAHKANGADHGQHGRHDAKANGGDHGRHADNADKADHSGQQANKHDGSGKAHEAQGKNGNKHGNKHDGSNKAHDAQGKHGGQQADIGKNGRNNVPVNYDRKANSSGNGEQGHSGNSQHGNGSNVVDKPDGAPTTQRSARGGGTSDNSRQATADRTRQAASRLAAGNPTQQDLQLLRHRAQQQNSGQAQPGSATQQPARGGDNHSPAQPSGQSQPKPPLSDTQWSRIQHQAAGNFAKKAENAPGDSPVARWAELQHYKTMHEAKQNPVSGEIDIDKVNADIKQLKNNDQAMKKIRTETQSSIVEATKQVTGKTPTKLAENYSRWMRSGQVQNYAAGLSPAKRSQFNAEHTDRIIGLNSKVGVDTKRALVKQALTQSPQDTARSAGEKSVTGGFVTLADAMLNRQQAGPQGEQGGPTTFDRNLLDARLGTETVDGLRSAWQALSPPEQQAAMHQVAEDGGLFNAMEAGQAAPAQQFNPDRGATRSAAAFARNFVHAFKGAGLYKTAAGVAAGTALVKRIQSIGNGRATPFTSFATLGDFMSLVGNLGHAGYSGVETGARALGFRQTAQDLHNEREPGGSGEGFLKGMGIMSSQSAAMYGFASLGASLTDAVAGRNRQAGHKAGLGAALLGIGALGTWEAAGDLTPHQRAWSGAARAALGGLGRYFSNQDFKLYNEGGGQAAGEGNTARRPVNEQMQAQRDQLRLLSGDGGNNDYLTDSGEQDLATLNNYLDPGDSDNAAAAPQGTSYFHYGDKLVSLTNAGGHYLRNVSSA